MPIPAGAGGMHGPSTFDKLKMGALMGTSVGLCIGFIFGGYSIMRYGAGPNGLLRSLGQYMLGSAATFGFFMSIGTAIRTETHNREIEELLRKAKRLQVERMKPSAVGAGERRYQWPSSR